MPTFDEVILGTEDVDVLGPPSEISVDVDFGPDGERGSKIFIGAGSPNTTVPNPISEDPLVYDLYINTSTQDPENYLAVYQYVKSPTETWEKRFKLVPNTLIKNYEDEQFDSGQLTLNIPLVDIVSSSSVEDYVSSQFNVQCTVVGGNYPISQVISISSIVEQPGGIFVLPISIKAIEFDGSTWQNVDGQRTIHLSINVV
jgi:hypothetical protein